ncbi:hypothetical protein CBR_g12324 [Chara braunii]|uniref:Uncharacterized protein n=1 Tax=Chara braunii TaxID=69332 RepID=A0A388KRT5_CHABU|nr:hypothetical protein CBR_g12324 [Chara braunii]|eukprot:GBG72756.1 hypothetical protein CBR_g12324 [Chara braunii]
MGHSRTRSRSRSPTRRSKKDDSRRGRSPARGTERSPDRSSDDKSRRREKRRSRSSSTSSRRRKRSSSRDRGRNDWDDDRRGEFPYNKPAPGNRAWFTVELRDEMYALRRELDRLRKRVGKLSNEFRAHASEKPADAITTDMLKQAVEKAVLEAMSEFGILGKKKSDIGTDQTRLKAQTKADEAARMATLKRQLEDMELRYDLANLQGQINSYKSLLTKPFTSPKPRAPLTKTPKRTPNTIGAGPSGVQKSVIKKGVGRHPNGVRISARRQILEGRQLSESMLSALQMDDLKKLCAKYNVR